VAARSVLWDPEQRRPADADVLEQEIARVAPASRVKLTWLGDAWLVRALAPAALCNRGPVLSQRDVSATIAELLADHGHPARVGGKTETS
jgi:hypothetical protein